MERDISLKDSLSLIEENHNRASILYFQNQLEQGAYLQEILEQLCPNSLWKQLEGFLRFLSFPKALTLSIRLSGIEREQRQRLQKKLSYPLFLLLLVFLGTYAFSYFVLPTMKRVLDSFSLDPQILKAMEFRFQLLWLGFGLLFLLGMLLYPIVKQEKIQIILFRLCTKVMPHSYIVQKGSMAFVQYYLECLRLKQSTKESFELLSELKKQCIVRYIAKEFDRHLNQGISFKKLQSHRLMEPNLQRFFQISYYFQDRISPLEHYLELAKERQQKRLNQFSMVIQCLAYLQIGYLLMVMYQVILFPMQFLQQL